MPKHDLTCKTCQHWRTPTREAQDSRAAFDVCIPRDPDTGEKMKRGFETRLCDSPLLARYEAPVAANGFAITDASEYEAMLATGQDFGCVLHEKAAGGD